MNGREDQIILVEQRIAGPVAGRIRRIERQLGQKSLAARIGRGDLDELQQIGLAQHGIVVDAVEVRLVPAAHQVELGGPARRAAADQANRLDKGGPMLGRRRRRLDVAQRGHRVGLLRNTLQNPRRRGRSGARQQLITRKPATRSRGFSAQRRNASMSLMWAASKNFRPPNFTNGMLRRVSSTSSGRCDARRGTKPPAS